MEDYLYQKDLFLPLGGVAKNSMAMKDEEWDILDRKALGTIWLSLAASVAFNISKEKTMKDLMEALAKLSHIVPRAFLSRISHFSFFVAAGFFSILPNCRNRSF